MKIRRKLSQDDSTLRGVQIVEIGEVDGHDFQINENFLNSVVDLGNKAGSVKVRLNHPEGRGDVMSIVGEAVNFRRDGSCVRADVKLFDLPVKQHIITLARQAGHLFGMSLDFAGEVVKKAGQKLKEMTCDVIYGVDIVDTPAATRALFSEGEDNKHWRVYCKLEQLQVDSSQQMEEEESDMTKELKQQLAKKFGIREDAKDFEAQLATKLAEEPAGGHPEPDGDEGYEKIMAKLEDMEQRLRKLENPEATDDEVPVTDEEKETAMAAMAAKVCSIMLAKVGIQPRKASAPATDGEQREEQLSAEEEKLAKQIGMDEKERKQFAANLTAAKRVKI